MSILHIVLTIGVIIGLVLLYVFVIAPFFGIWPSDDVDASSSK